MTWRRRSRPTRAPASEADAIVQKFNALSIAQQQDVLNFLSARCERRRTFASPISARRRGSFGLAAIPRRVAREAGVSVHTSRATRGSRGYVEGAVGERRDGPCSGDVPVESRGAVGKMTDSRDGVRGVTAYPRAERAAGAR